MRYFITLCLGVMAACLAPTLLAQNKVLIIQESLDTKAAVKPANAYVTLPDTGAIRFNVNLAAKLNAGWLDLELGPYAEVHANDDVKKPQRVLTLGLSLSLYAFPLEILDADRGTIGMDGRMNVKRDWVDTTWTLQAAATTTYIAPSTKTLLPNSSFEILGGVFTWAPYIGLEFDHVLARDKDTSEGSVMRLSTALGATFFPGETIPSTDRPISISFALNQRRSFFNEYNGEFRWYRLLVIGVNYTFPHGKDNPAAGIGLSYNDGEDPSQGLKQQTFWKFGLTLQL